MACSGLSSILSEEKKEGCECPILLLNLPACSMKESANEKIWNYYSHYASNH